MEDLKEIKDFFYKYNVKISKVKIFFVIALSILSVVINICLPLITQKIVDDGLIRKVYSVVVFWCLIFTLFFVIQIIMSNGKLLAEETAHCFRRFLRSTAFYFR